MGYIEQSLGQNETLLYKARFHWRLLRGCVGRADPDHQPSSSGSFSMLRHGRASGSCLSGCIIGLLILLADMILIWTTEIAVTNHRLIVKHGWLGAVDGRTPTQSD